MDILLVEASARNADPGDLQSQSVAAMLESIFRVTVRVTVSLKCPSLLGLKLIVKTHDHNVSPGSDVSLVELQSSFCAHILERQPRFYDRTLSSFSQC